MVGMVIWVVVCAWVITMAATPLMWVFPTPTLFVVVSSVLWQVVRRCDREIELVAAIDDRRHLVKEVKNLRRLMVEQDKQNRRFLQNMGVKLRRCRSI